MPSKKHSQASERGQSMTLMISHCILGPGCSFYRNYNEVRGCDAAARRLWFPPALMWGCWAGDDEAAETVGTTLKRRMQTTPFLSSPIEGAVATKSRPILSSFTSLPFQQHLTFNRPDAHPPPHPKRRKKETKQERKTASDKTTRDTEHHQRACFNNVGDRFAFFFTSNSARLTATRKHRPAAHK